MELSYRAMEACLFKEVLYNCDVVMLIPKDHRLGISETNVSSDILKFMEPIPGNINVKRCACSYHSHPTAPVLHAILFSQHRHAFDYAVKSHT